MAALTGVIGEKDRATAERVVGIMSAIVSVGERLTLAKSFVHWSLAPVSRHGFVTMVRESAKTLAAFADDLERAWAEDDIARPE